MQNTVFEGQCCITQHNCFTVNRGDVITLNVIDKEDNTNHFLIKRIIGISGDKLLYMMEEKTRTVHLYICKPGETSFSLYEEDYIKETMLLSVISYGSFILPTTPLDTITVTENGLVSDVIPQDILTVIEEAIINVPMHSIYFMGDNRNCSRDSRYYGTQDISNIVAKVLYIPKLDSTFDKFLKFIKKYRMIIL